MSDVAIHPAQGGGISTVVFDLGQVVLGWDPLAAFTDVLPRAEVADWMARVGFVDWNRQQDAGRTWATAEDELITRFPAEAAAIRAYRANFDRTLTGYVPGTGAVVAELEQAGVAPLALTNWSAETFPMARDRFGLLDRFRGIVVSGEEGMVKPDPALFSLLCERYLLDPARILFVDDSSANCAGGESVGMHAHHFGGAAGLRSRLVELGVLPTVRPAVGPVWHLAERTAWTEAERTGEYPWSSRSLSYERQGFVHLCFEEQVADVRHRHHRDLADSDLVLVELNPDRDDLPVVVEPVPGVGDHPHLFAQLSPRMAVSVRGLA